MMPYISVVCMVAALTFASSPTAAMGPSIVDAEERVRELSGILANVKNSILPRHCNELKHAGQDTSGVYRIFHKEAGSSGQRVYCDMDTDGGGWTVIQRRGQFGNRVFHFYRNWTEYARGFGNPADEYWIGKPIMLPNAALQGKKRGKT
ncbi:techylectin-5A-like [Haemaphysalis longicornis]